MQENVYEISIYFKQKHTLYRKLSEENTFEQIYETLFPYVQSSGNDLIELEAYDRLFPILRRKADTPDKKYHLVLLQQQSPKFDLGHPAGELLKDATNDNHLQAICIRASYTFDGMYGEDKAQVTWTLNCLKDIETLVIPRLKQTAHLPWLLSSLARSLSELRFTHQLPTPIPEIGTKDRDRLEDGLVHAIKEKLQGRACPIAHDGPAPIPVPHAQVSLAMLDEGYFIKTLARLKAVPLQTYHANADASFDTLYNRLMAHCKSEQAFIADIRARQKGFRLLCDKAHTPDEFYQLVLLQKESQEKHFGDPAGDFLERATNYRHGQAMCLRAQYTFRGYYGPAKEQIDWALQCLSVLESQNEWSIQEAIDIMRYDYRLPPCIPEQNSEAYACLIDRLVSKINEKRQWASQYGVKLPLLEYPVPNTQGVLLKDSLPARSKEPVVYLRRFFSRGDNLQPVSGNVPVGAVAARSVFSATPQQSITPMKDVSLIAPFYLKCGMGLITACFSLLLLSSLSDLSAPDKAVVKDSLSTLSTAALMFGLWGMKQVIDEQKVDHRFSLRL